MERLYYQEMVLNLDKIVETKKIEDKTIYLFGHCNATEELADLFLERGIVVKAILDNNTAKHGNTYRSIPVVPPQDILEEPPEHTAVYIVARAYEAMNEQLRKIGYQGEIHKLVDYNSYAEYSLSEDTIRRKQERVRRGMLTKQRMEQKYPGYFKVLCPFSALGDICFTMSYLPHFLKKRKVENCIVGVIGSACAQAAELFCPDYGNLLEAENSGSIPISSASSVSYNAEWNHDSIQKMTRHDQPRLCIETFSQQDMDEMIQACLYTRDTSSFIAHQDRPYVVNLHKALYVKCIPLEQIYCCGVFGLPADTEPARPRRERFQEFSGLSQMKKGKSVIFSPYAKSVTALPKSFWQWIVCWFRSKGYQCFTNVAGEEQPLEGTMGISPKIAELQSAVEYAGTFIGIRSGICDVLKYAECRKIAFYPDYNYSDTKWKAIDMYALKGWKNIVIRDDWNERKEDIVHFAENMDL